MHPSILAEMAEGRREQLIQEATRAHNASDAAARRDAVGRSSAADSAPAGLRAAVGGLLVRTGRRLAGSNAAEA